MKKYFIFIFTAFALLNNCSDYIWEILTFTGTLSQGDSEEPPDSYGNDADINKGFKLDWSGYWDFEVTYKIIDGSEDINIDICYSKQFQGGTGGGYVGLFTLKNLELKKIADKTCTFKTENNYIDYFLNKTYMWCTCI